MFSVPVQKGDAITVYGHKTNGSVHLISVKTGILVSQIDIETILWIYNKGQEWKKKIREGF